MPVYDDRSKEPVHPYRPRPSSTGREAEPALPPAPLQRAEAKAPATPHGARLQREWLHLEIQRYRRRLEEIREALEGLAGRIQQRRGNGTPLPPALHSRLEAHLGAPLPKIVIHADDEADALAGALGAEAFTHGNDVFFRRGAYDPHGEAGQRLLAHEAAHVLQQSRGLAPPGLDPDPALEEQARQVEQGFVPRPACTLRLLPGLEVRIPAEERQWLDEGSALSLRGEYRSLAHKLVQAYRQGSSAAEVAHALHQAEAATQMPLLEAVLTFLGRAEGLKGSLLEAYQKQAEAKPRSQPAPTPPSPAQAQAQPALQRKEKAKPAQALTPDEARRLAEMLLTRNNLTGATNPGKFGEDIVAGLRLMEQKGWIDLELHLVPVVNYVLEKVQRRPKLQRSLLQALEKHGLAYGALPNPTAASRPKTPTGGDLPFHAFLEQIAMDMVYEVEGLFEADADQKPDSGSGTTQAQVDARKRLLQYFGYRAHKTVKGVMGFEMKLFTPVPREQLPPEARERCKDYTMPIVAFRGSEGGAIASKSYSSGRADWLSDFADPQVGLRQFQANRDLIADVMATAKAASKSLPWVTGHSLGGALAQTVACEMPQFVGHVVTFQAPGIDAKTLQKLKDFNAKQADPGRRIGSTHVHYSGDLVERAGEGYTDGVIESYKLPHSLIGKGFINGITEVINDHIGASIILGNGLLEIGWVYNWVAERFGKEAAANLKAGCGEFLDLLCNPKFYRTLVTMPEDTRRLLIRTGLTTATEHTTLTYTSILLQQNPEYGTLFAGAKGSANPEAPVAFAASDNRFVGSKRTDQLEKRVIEPYRKEIGYLIGKAFDDWNKANEADPRFRLVDTSREEFIKVFKTLSDIARLEQDKEKAYQLMLNMLDSTQVSNVFSKIPANLRRQYIDWFKTNKHLYEIWHAWNQDSKETYE